MSQHRSPNGFTLLEVLVATVIMGIAVVSLLSDLSTSLSNAARLTDYDRASLIAQRTMDELMTRPDVPKGVDISGEWDSAVVGVEGGWRGRVTPFERPPHAGPGQLGLDRYVVEVWWLSGGQRKTFTLEGYRAEPLTPRDMEMGTFIQ